MEKVAAMVAEALGNRYSLHMSLRHFFFSLVLLLGPLNAVALPTDEPVQMESPDTPEFKEPETPSIKDPKLETLSLPTSPVLDKKETETFEKPFFYKYSESISLRIGTAADFKEIRRTTPEEKEYSTAFSFKYLLPSDTYKHLEVGLDYLTQPKLYLTGLYRFIYERTEKIRPTLGIGLSMRFDEGDKFETPFALNSYALYLNAGLERFVKNTKSVRLDLDVHTGSKDFLVLLLLGYSWGF